MFPATYWWDISSHSKGEKEEKKIETKEKGRGCLFSTHKHSLNDLSNTANFRQLVAMAEPSYATF